MKREDISKGAAVKLVVLLPAVLTLLLLLFELLSVKPVYQHLASSPETEKEDIKGDGFPFGAKRPSSMTIFYMDEEVPSASAAFIEPIIRMFYNTHT